MSKDGEEMANMHMQRGYTPTVIRENENLTHIAMSSYIFRRSPVQKD